MVLVQSQYGLSVRVILEIVLRKETCESYARSAVALLGRRNEFTVSGCTFGAETLARAFVKMGCGAEFDADRNLVTVSPQDLRNHKA